LTEVNVKIHHEIQGGPESPFPLVYVEQTSVQNKTNKKSPEKCYEDVQKHMLGFKNTFYSI